MVSVFGYAILYLIYLTINYAGILGKKLGKLCKNIFRCEAKVKVRELERGKAYKFHAQL